MAFSSSERSSGVPPGVDRPFEVADPACITDHHRLETGFREGLGHAEITIDELSDHDRVGSRSCVTFVGRPGDAVGLDLDRKSVV